MEDDRFLKRLEVYYHSKEIFCNSSDMITMMLGFMMTFTATPHLTKIIVNTKVSLV